MELSFAIVTPSFKNDFERCQILAESIKEYSQQNVNHYVIVEKKDEKLFKTLEGHNIKIIKKEKILPWWIKQLPLTVKGKNIWISLKGKVLRGWIIQQMIKIGIANHLQEDVLIYMDSDEFFIRKVNFLNIFTKNGKIRLYKKPGRTDARWDKTISRLLNLEIERCKNINYVEHPVTWYRKNRVM